MNRETDKRIAKWLGWFQLENGNWYHNKTLQKTEYKYLIGSTLPLFSTSDSIAITLLPVLVTRGYHYSIKNLESWTEFILYKDPAKKCISSGLGTTISEAITSAVIALIEKEIKE